MSHVYFRDHKVDSPSGHYRLLASSPDNSGLESRPFARNYQARLVSLADGKSLWKAGLGDRCLEWAYVDDHGFSTLSFLAPAGEPTLQCRDPRGKVLAEISVSHQKRRSTATCFKLMYPREYSWSSNGSAGWATTAFPHFFGDGRYFGLLMSYGTRLVVDLEPGAVVVSPSQALRRAASESEKSKALDVLRSVNKDSETISRFAPGAITTLALHLSPPGSVEVERLLALDHRVWGQLELSYSCKFQRLYWVKVYPLRMAAKILLAALGRATDFRSSEVRTGQGGQAFPVTPFNLRTPFLTSLKPGTPLLSFLAQAGPPDVIRRMQIGTWKQEVREREYWIYFTGKGESLSALALHGTWESPMDKVTVLKRLDRRDCLDLLHCDDAVVFRPELLSRRLRLSRLLRFSTSRTWP